MQARNRYPKADTADPITLLEGKQYALFIFWGDVGKLIVIDDKWKGR
jgi:hypothetical protein